MFFAAFGHTALDRFGKLEIGERYVLNLDSRPLGRPEIATVDAAGTTR